MLAFAPISKSYFKAILVICADGAYIVRFSLRFAQCDLSYLNSI